MTNLIRRWISPKQAAEYLDLSAAAVYRLASQKKLPAARVGHSLRIDLVALNRQLESQVNVQVIEGTAVTHSVSPKTKRRGNKNRGLI